MDLAINEAWKYQGLTYPNPSVGSLILDKNGQILTVSVHRKSGEAHSEVLAIRDAYSGVTGDKTISESTDSNYLHNYLYENHNGIFEGATIYVTLEPCNHWGKTPPCSMIIEKLGFKKVVIGVKDSNPEATGGAEFLKNNGIKVEFCNGECQERANKLIEPFNLWSSKQFIFFKFAQTLNGNITDGVISSDKSRELVHNLRDKIDLLVIGGNTVRVDRPTLDSRLVDGKAPDIFIYSKDSDFDRTIPLFSVPDREVIISDNLSLLQNYKYIMVEGGNSMLKEFKDRISHLLLFVSPTINGLNNIQLFGDPNFEFLFQKKIGTDLLVWLKRESSL